MAKTEFAPHFDPCYIQGYTAALMDVLKTFSEIQTDLKIHRRKQNFKTYSGIVECMLENRTILRETTDAFVRCTGDTKNGFEVWRESWNKNSRIM